MENLLYFSTMNKLTYILGGAIVILAVIVIILSIDVHQMSHGDINRDGRVNALDESILLSHWTK